MGVADCVVIIGKYQLFGMADSGLMVAVMVHCGWEDLKFIVGLGWPILGESFIAWRNGDGIVK